jgi:excisionase family DNA binding protein
MTRRAPLSDLPFWPLYLSREEASRYVGASPEVFVDEVAQGLWPAPRRRGGNGGRLTWHRGALDRAADRIEGVCEANGPGPHLVAAGRAASEAPDRPHLMSLAAAADRINVHPETLRRAIRAGSLACHKFGGRARISEDQFQAYLDRSLQRQPEAQEAAARDEAIRAFRRDLRIKRAIAKLRSGPQ